MNMNEIPLGLNSNFEEKKNATCMHNTMKSHQKQEFLKLVWEGFTR